ncbi:MAG: heme utilization cystosolic carrier protein HutX [Hyphomicrobium sp.]|uniref:heme utilization cystosolic carrier protein HutX n=1 Tax=Hyphomicrobium sp. TaxID=82 RepID=UPI0039E61E4C
MAGTLTSEASERPSLRERLAKSADGILEQVAREYGVSTFEAVEALPTSHRAIVPGSAFEKILAALTSWGPVVFIVHTPDIVLECEGPIPAGTFARGYFNLHGDSPIGGHIKAENCTSIAFVMRPAKRSSRFSSAAMKSETSLKSRSNSSMR